MDTAEEEMYWNDGKEDNPKIIVAMVQQYRDKIETTLR